MCGEAEQQRGASATTHLTAGAQQLPTVYSGGQLVCAPKARFGQQYTHTFQPTSRGRPACRAPRQLGSGAQHAGCGCGVMPPRNSFGAAQQRA